MSHNNCHCHCQSRTSQLEDNSADCCASCCLWCVVFPLLTTGLFAFLKDQNISEKTKNESFVAFWVFVGIDSFVILICIISLICACFDIPGRCAECCKKKKEKSIVVQNPIHPVISIDTPVPSNGPMIV